MAIIVHGAAAAKKPTDKALQDVVDTACSPGNYDATPYLYGMANGLRLAFSIITKKPVEYLQRPRRWLDRRHSIIEEIADERARQVNDEGWPRERDDQLHTAGQLATAAACYALSASGVLGTSPKLFPPCYWPWRAAFWKPKDKRRDLVRAAALIVAEIERLDRAAAAAA